jgi:glycosyltransferase involved in cell wall biosynthesis
VKASVIICTHNPRPDFLAQVFAALRRQTLPASAWEFLVVDNASAAPLAPQLDLCWHPSPKIVREETLGLTHARLRGIAETTGDVLVFVDDDNVLDAHYLEQALAIAGKNARIGSWGGAIHPQFEQPPPEWTRPYWRMLAIREVTVDQIGNSPVGAGFCIRRPVALHYCQQVIDCPLRLALDRVGSSLVSAGDMDLARCAEALDLEVGVFASLRLKHLIPAYRLTEEYLLRLMEAMEFSNLFFAWLNSKDKMPPDITLRKRVKIFYDSIRKFGRKRRFHQAKRRGSRTFQQILPLLQVRASHQDVSQLIHNLNTGLSSGLRISTDGKHFSCWKPE